MNSSELSIGGALPVKRLGFGAMRITGRGVWGEPADEPEVLRVLRRLPDVGVNFIDTADSYGPEVSERLIRKALWPYPAGLVIATKAGLRRPGPDRWEVHGDPAYLIRQAHASRERLGVERIDLWQLHRIDPGVPADEQFGAVRELLDTGVIAHAGLSEVGVDAIEAASRHFPVASVQNRYNIGDRASQDVLDYCSAHGIAFIPWYPLAAGAASDGKLLERIGAAHGATASQVALAWLLQRSPVMMPIPGTSKVAHLEENMGAAALRLNEADLQALDGASR